MMITKWFTNIFEYMWYSDIKNAAEKVAATQQPKIITITVTVTVTMIMIMTILIMNFTHFIFIAFAHIEC